MRPSKRKKERERENFADVSSLGNTLRSADEFNKAHIPGAVQLSGDELLVALPEDKATPILLYCNSGRSGSDCALREPVPRSNIYTSASGHFRVNLLERSFCMAKLAET